MDERPGLFIKFSCAAKLHTDLAFCTPRSFFLSLNIAEGLKCNCESYGEITGNAISQVKNKSKNTRDRFR